MRRMTPSLLIAFCFVPTATAADQSEVLPPPRLVEYHVSFEVTRGGYQVILSRKATDRLLEALTDVGDGKAIADLTKAAAKDLNDPKAEATLELIGWVIKTQAPALKKALDEKAGPGGAVIRVYGLEQKRMPERPVIKAAIEAFAPDKVKDYIKTTAAVVNTTPLYWKVEGRK